MIKKHKSRRNRCGIRRQGDEVLSSDDESNDSMDSMNSALIGKVYHFDVLKMVCYNWSSCLTIKMKEEWKTRANSLNLRPLPGKLTQIPVAIGRRSDGG